MPALFNIDILLIPYLFTTYTCLPITCSFLFFYYIHVYSFILYVPKQQSGCGVFFLKEKANLQCNTGHAAEITEQVVFFLKEKPISQATLVMLLRSQSKCHRIISSFTSHLCALQERVIMNKHKIYSANQPNNKGLMHSTFLPPNLVIKEHVTSDWRDTLCITKNP